MKFKGKVRKQGSDRKVIEVPIAVRDQVESGDECYVDILDRKGKDKLVKIMQVKQNEK